MDTARSSKLEPASCVVLVAYNSADIISDAVSSIDPSAEIIVVDNASSDEIRSVIDAKKVLLIQNTKNLGFGTACNIGAAATAAQFVLFLNLDARLQDGALGLLLGKARSDTNLGALNPRILGSDGRQVQRRHPRLLQREANSRLEQSLYQDCKVEMISGAALFCRKTCFREVGGFDENIFLFCEDDGIAIRLRAAGYSLGYVHDAVVEHAGGKSTTPSPRLDRFKSYHFMRSGIYARRKHGIAVNRDYHVA